jgi:hypothetical protein
VSQADESKYKIIQQQSMISPSKMNINQDNYSGFISKDLKNGTTTFDIKIYKPVIKSRHGPNE